MMNKEFLSGRMEKSLEAAKRILVNGFNAEGADYTFNPIVELYNIKGRAVLVGDGTGDKHTYKKAVRRIVKKTKAVAAIVVSDARVWNEAQTEVMFESIGVWTESKNKDINGMFICQPYTREGGEIVFKKPEQMMDFHHIPGGFGNFFKNR